MKTKSNNINDNKKKPASFLVDNISLLPKGRALDIAMGKGRNAIYLAGMGYQVEGVDISTDAVECALERAKASGVTITALVGDLELEYRIRENSYDIIICFNYLQRSLIPDMKKGLRVGGVIVYETFTVDQTNFGKPKNPAHLLKHNELINMFRDFRCLQYHEGIIDNRKAVAGIVAEKKTARR